MKKLSFKRIVNCIKRPEAIILCLLFVLHTFFSFYGFENKHGFEWDQVDNAWAAKNIIVDQKYPLVGMVAKQNSGFYIGPLYYYYIAVFYFLTNLDPVASVYIAGVTSAITFIILYVFTKKLFSTSIALVSLFIFSMSTYIISADRVQWPVNLLAPISIVIFYLLYKIITGSEKYIFWLAVALGLSWQLNFTAVFFFIITLCVLPFFPRSRNALKYIFLAIPVAGLFFLPNIIFDFLNKGSSSHHLSTYISTYYHGLHATRILQLAKDAFIEFAGIFDNFFIKDLRYFFILAFFVLYLKNSITKNKLLFCYLVVLWFIVPWGVFSVYKGEISNYYFSLTRPITLMILAFLTVWIYKLKFIPAKLGVILFWGAFVYSNISQFFVPMYRPLSLHRKNVQDTVRAGQKIEFAPGNPESYLYYVYAEHGKNKEKNN